MRLKSKLVWSAATAFLVLIVGAFLRSTALRENPLPFWSVGFSPDGRTLVTGGGGVGRPIGGLPGELIFWNVATGKRRVIQEQGSVRRVIFNRSFVVIGTLSGITTLVNPITGKPLVNLSPPNELLNGVAVSGDGQLIVSAGLDGTIGLWDSSGKEEQTFRQDKEAFVDVALSPDKKIVVATSRSGKAFVYDLAHRENPLVLAACEGNLNAECVGFAPDGRHFVTGAQTALRVWETGSGKRVWDAPTLAVVNAVAYTQNGQMIATLDTEGRLALFDSQAGGLVKSTPAHNSTAFGLAISPDNLHIATVARDDFTLKIWKIPTLELVKSFHRPKPAEK